MSNHWFGVVVLSVLFALSPQIMATEKAFNKEGYELKALGLTPLGAELAGSENGRIPAWDINKPFSEEMLQKIASESPLFYVDANSLSKHLPYLSEGLTSLIQRYPDTFKIPVYQSYRTHRVPDYIYQAAEKNHHSATLIDEGNGIKDVWQGPPFPVPENPLHVIWNHLVSWRGLHVTSNLTEVLVQSDNSYQIIRSNAEVASPYYDPARDIFSSNHIKTYYLTHTQSPARLAGGALLVFDTLNHRLDPRKAWFYDPERRRILRIPALEHDTPNPSSETVRVVDEVDLFNGLPERYNWKLLGKRPLFIPYNNENFLNFSENDLTHPHHINLTNTRYELHRVWVVEGNLKQDHQHIYKRRLLYFDEDTWLAVMAEQYDRDNTLWRVSISYTKYFPEMPGVWKLADTFHDLKNGRHFTQAMEARSEGKIKFYNELPPKKRFSPASLRSSSKR